MEARYGSRYDVWRAGFRRFPRRRWSNVTPLGEVRSQLIGAVPVSLGTVAGVAAATTNDAVSSRQRWQVESLVSRHKRLLGAVLRTRTWLAHKQERLVRSLTYNPMRLSFAIWVFNAENPEPKGAPATVPRAY